MAKRGCALPSDPFFGKPSGGRIRHREKLLAVLDCDRTIARKLRRSEVLLRVANKEVSDEGATAGISSRKADLVVVRRGQRNLLVGGLPLLVKGDDGTLHGKLVAVEKGNDLGLGPNALRVGGHRGLRFLSGAVPNF